MDRKGGRGVAGGRVLSELLGDIVGYQLRAKNTSYLCSSTLRNNPALGCMVRETMYSDKLLDPANC